MTRLLTITRCSNILFLKECLDAFYLWHNKPSWINMLIYTCLSKRYERKPTKPHMQTGISKNLEIFTEFFWKHFSRSLNILFCWFNCCVADDLLEPFLLKTFLSSCKYFNSILKKLLKFLQELYGTVEIWVSRNNKKKFSISPQEKKTKTWTLKSAKRSPNKWNFSTILQGNYNISVRNKENPYFIQFR